VPITMYDDTSVSLIPAGAEAVAAYVDGRFANLNAVKQRFPKAKILTITVLGGTADAGDIETGDMTPKSGAAWAKRMMLAGHRRPVVYANRSTMPAVIAELRKLGITRAQVRLWVADYTGVPHFPTFQWGSTTTSADGCQFTDKALGRSLDESILRDDFFDLAHTADARKRKVWRTHLDKARTSLAHCLAYRQRLRDEHKDSGAAYAASTVRMHALKAYITALEALLGH